jgi:hypothetical protein
MARGLLFAVLICLLSSASAMAANVDLNGTWRSAKYGTCTITQNGDQVVGVLKYPSGGTGNLAGRVTNRTLTYEWAHNTDRGIGAFILSVSGSTLSGYWESSQTGKMDDWVLTKQ